MLLVRYGLQTSVSPKSDALPGRAVDALGA